MVRKATVRIKNLVTNLRDTHSTTRQRKRRFGEFNYWIFVSIWVLIILPLISLLGCTAEDYYSPKGRYNLAIDNFKKALEPAPSVFQAVEIRYYLGHAYYANSQYDLAIDNYNTALEIDESHFTDIATTSHLKMPSYEAWPEKNAKLAEFYHRFYYRMGIHYWANGKYDLAIDSYRKALEIAPRDTHVYSYLGLAYDAKGQYDLVIDTYRKALEIAPDNPLAYRRLADAYDAKGKYDLAIDSYRKALEIAPRISDYYFDLGNAYAAKGQYDLAIDNYRKAFEPTLNMRYASTSYAAKGQYDLVIDTYRKALEIAPDNPLAYRGLGLAYYVSGQYDLAIDNYRKAFELNPMLAKRYLKVPFYDEYPSQKIVLPEYTIEDPIVKQVREAYAQIDEIKGAIYDEETGWPIFFGSIKGERDSKSLMNLDELIMCMGESLMNLDELIMCMKVIQSGEDPGVSIEPPGMASPLRVLPASIPDYQNVRYIPESIKGTQLGKKVFEADRALKGLGFGEDPITHREVSSRIAGYKTLPERARQLAETKAGYFGRIWFKPKEVSLKRGEDIVEFDKITIKVESESPYPTPSQFASHFEKHYAEFSLALPIYRELRRIGKEVAIARWLKERYPRLDLESYRMQPVYTPSKTDTLKGVIRREIEGPYLKVSALIGGVIYDVRNQYEDSFDLENIKNLILNARANKTDIVWNFEIDNKKYIAVALPFH